MYQKNILCPYCGYSFTGGYKNFVGTGSLLGVPYMRCGNCQKLCDTGKLAWSQMNPFGKLMEISVALFKTFFSAMLFSLIIGLILALLFRPTHEWMQANRSWVIYLFLFLGLALSILRTALYYSNLVPEVERITREKKWDEWTI
jgi:hypothetical protein